MARILATKVKVPEAVSSSSSRRRCSAVGMSRSDKNVFVLMGDSETGSVIGGMGSIDGAKEGREAERLLIDNRGNSEGEVNFLRKWKEEVHRVFLGHFFCSFKQNMFLFSN